MLRSLRQLGIVGNPAPWDCIPVPVIPANSRDSESMNLRIIKTNEQTKKVGELTSFPNLNFFVRPKTYINYLNKQPSVHSVECLVQLLSDKSHGQSRKSSPMGLQKIEDRNYVRDSSSLRKLLFVIYTSKMLTT